MIGPAEILDGQCPLVRVQRVEGSRSCVVVFSHLDYPPRHFAMSRALKEFDSNVVYLNCLDNAWYQTGLGEHTRSIRETASLLERLLGHLGVDDVVTAGMSMGGYAAVLFGLLLGCRSILAFTPELLLGQPHGRSFTLNRRKVYDHRYFSLSGIIRAKGSTKINIVYGAYDLIDLSLMWPLADFALDDPSCRLFFVGGDHKVTLRLSPQALLETLRDRPALEADDLATDLTLLRPPGREEILSYPLIQRHQAAREAQKVYDLVGAVEGAPRTAQMELFFAAACADLGRLDEGLAAVERALAIDPRGYSLHHMAGLLHQRLGRLEAAEAAYATAIAIRPEATISVFRRATTLAGLGRTGEAERAYRAILEKQPDHAEAAAHLGRLASPGSR